MWFGIGGVEVMSRGGYLSPTLRNGARMGDSVFIDMMTATHWSIWCWSHGDHSRKVASKWNISREEQDDFAVLTKKAIFAIDSV